MARGNGGHQCPRIKLTELRSRIAERMDEAGYYRLYNIMSREGLIPLKRNGEHLDIGGFRRVYYQVRADRDKGFSDFAVRFLYRAAAAAATERVSTVREVGRMLDISAPTVQDILINHGDI